MNVIILFLALLLAVAADEDAKPLQLRARELQVDGEVCIDFDGVGEVTVDVTGGGEDGNYTWFLQQGATSNACTSPAQISNLINNGTQTFCRRINSLYHELIAPAFAYNWLEAVGWEEGNCGETNKT